MSSSICVANWLPNGKGKGLRIPTRGAMLEKINGINPTMIPLERKFYYVHYPYRKLSTGRKDKATPTPEMLRQAAHLGPCARLKALCVRGEEIES